MLTHDCLGVNLERVWQTTHTDLPPFAQEIAVVPNEMPADGRDSA